jgi:hypothetical protein
MYRFAAVPEEILRNKVKTEALISQVNAFRDGRSVIDIRLNRSVPVRPTSTLDQRR